MHEAAEAYEKGKVSGEPLTVHDAQDVFRESYQTHINEACEVTPNFEYWFASGPYQGEEDIERRYGIGLQQVEKFVNWTETHPEDVVWIAEDGTPGIEIGFDIDLDGVKVRGFIDAVLMNGCGDEVHVRDLKTGNQPGDDFQLGVYGVALAEQYGVIATTGDYWMGKSGKPTYPFKIGEWTRERVSERFHDLEEKLQAGDFPALPDQRVCNFCDVAAHCEYRA